MSADTGNPFDNSPYYVDVLKQLLLPSTVKNGIPPRLPAPGGEQISVRFTKERLEILNDLSELCGLSRNRIVDLLVEDGLRRLHQGLKGSPDFQSEIQDKISELFSGHG